MSSVPALEQAMLLIIESRSFSNLFPKAIDVALMPPAPAGIPEAIGGSPAGEGGIAKVYESIGANSGQVCSGLNAVANSLLPSAWRGQAAENAKQAVQATAVQTAALAEVFNSVSSILTSWASRLADAQRRDQRGRGLLEQARGQAAAFSRQPTTFVPKSLAGADAAVWDLAMGGCQYRLAAAQIMDAGVSETVDGLNELAARARARQIDAPGIDPLSSVVLAYSSDNSNTADPLTDILTLNGMSRASQLLSAMSPDERAVFEKMLADAKSPQEAAYLWKALGASATLDPQQALSQVQQFDEVIHPHGDNLPWLNQHLNPNINDTNTAKGNAGLYTLNYDGQKDYPARTKSSGNPFDYKFWDQPTSGGYDFYNQLTNGDNNSGDCVAASTVMARAANDPMYMLGMTTGQGPMAVGGATPGDDSPKAVHDRLEQNYTSNYQRNGADTNANANTLLKGVTGSTYQSTPVTTVDERQKALPTIETAVNAGKPVPLDVYPDGSGDGHQVMILAAQGDKLEIYNPWGFTEWVGKDQFIQGQLGELTADSPAEGLHNPTNAELPR